MSDAVIKQDSGEEPHESPAARRRLLEAAERAIPPLCDKSNVGVLRTAGTATIPLATGTLIKIADRCFVVTAAHAVRDAHSAGSGLVITGSDGRAIAVPGEWTCSPETGRQPDNGLGDIAVYPLNDTQVTGLEGKEFVGLRDMAVGQALDRGYFQLIGYPMMFCEASESAAQRVQLGAMKLGTTVHRGDHSGLADYDPDVHFLLSGGEEGFVDERGEDYRLRGRHGVNVRLVDNLKGVSGAGVWRIGKPGVPVQRWLEHTALVGVEIATYGQPEVIKVTRWRFVTLLIYERFPSLRDALRILTPPR